MCVEMASVKGFANARRSRGPRKQHYMRDQNFAIGCQAEGWGGV